MLKGQSRQVGQCGGHMSDRKALRELYEESVQFIARKTNFDFLDFLKHLGPTASFDEPLGPSSKCLSVDRIRALAFGELKPADEEQVTEHLTGCDICSSLVRTYLHSKPDRMPELLYERISKSSERRPRPVRRHPSSIWTSLEHKFIWLAVPALVLSFWVVYPYSGPYFRKSWSYSKDAWTAFWESQKNEQEQAREQQVRSLKILAGVIPDDPDAIRPAVEGVKAASKLGEFPSSSQIRAVRTNLENKGKEAGRQGVSGQVWHAYAMELAGVETLVRYEALRKDQHSNVPPARDLNIVEFSAKDGVPTIKIGSDKIQNQTVKFLMERSFEQTPDINNLHVLRGDSLALNFRRQKESNSGKREFE